jgi:glyoxylase-like metal-dependent hydrolase (beta-lactamase superfamily II)
LKFGGPFPDAEFAVPADYRRIDSYDPEMQWETIRPGVHVVRYVPDGYNVLCVEFADKLIVVETPEGNTRVGLSERVIGFIKQSLPGKPIRYAVPTHHHSDHVGGIRAYLAEGATIVSTRGNEALLRQIAARRSSIAPDALDRSMAAPSFSFLQAEKMEFRDATQELELHHIGPTPHVTHILIAYLPKERILFQTDLFNPWSCFRERVPNEDIGHTTALGDTQALLAAVERLGLPVERVIGGHGRDVDYAWLKAFTARRAADGLPMWGCAPDQMR